MRRSTLPLLVGVMVALATAVERGATHITVIAGGGDRPDHVFAMLHSLAADRYSPATIDGHLGTSRFHVCHAHNPVDIHTQPGDTVVVVGMGRIGAKIAQLTKAFGMHVIGIRHDPLAGPNGADEIFGMDGDVLADTLSSGGLVDAARQVRRLGAILELGPARTFLRHAVKPWLGRLTGDPGLRRWRGA
mgnify:CR=1 FL=1